MRSMRCLMMLSGKELLRELGDRCIEVLNSSLGQVHLPESEYEYTIGILTEIQRRIDNGIPFNDCEWSELGDFRHNPRTVLVGRISELLAEIYMGFTYGLKYEIIPTLGSRIDSSGIDFRMVHKSDGSILNCQVKTLELIDAEGTYIINLYNDQFDPNDPNSNRVKYDDHCDIIIIRMPTVNKLLIIDYDILRNIYDQLPYRPIGCKQFDITKYMRGERGEGIKIWDIPIEI